MPEAKFMVKHPKRGKYPLVYLSGRYSAGREDEIEWVKRTGCMHRMYNFAYIYPGAFYYRDIMEETYKLNMEMGCQIAIDSSAFSFHRMVHGSTAVWAGAVTKKSRNKVPDAEKLRGKVIEQYIEFCKRDRHRWDFYITFDYVKHQPTIYKIQHRLQAAGLRPVPVYHGDHDLTWMRRYIDEGHKILCVGTMLRTWRSRRNYYDRVFNEAEKRGVLLHGLAVTSLSQMLEYPWFSVDSSTWARAAGYGHILYVDHEFNSVRQIHISDREADTGRTSYNRMAPSVQKIIRRQVESRGFDFQKVRTVLNERFAYNGWVYSHIPELSIEKTSSRVTWEDLI